MSKTSPMRVFAIFFMAVFFSCSPYRPDPLPSVTEDIPEAYTGVTQAADPERRWWETFQDDELNSFVDAAFAESPDLFLLFARLRQARASAVVAGADLYPDLTGSGDVAYARRRVKNGVTQTTSPKEYSAGLASSYELDMWGKIRAEKEAAVQAVAAREEDLNAAAVTLAAEVADRWLQIVSQKMQIGLLNKQLEINRTFLELIELRFRQAMVSALDVYQQQQVIDRLRAEIPLAQAEKSRLANELSVLLGTVPGSIDDVSRDELPGLPPAPPAGIPADLLRYRPDIRAAQKRLESAGWDVAAARADRMPSATISARGLFSSEHLDLLLDNWLLSLAGGITAPIFDGGRREAEVDRNVAVVDENLAAYRQAVLGALLEVEDAMVTEERLKEHIRELEKVAETARKALRQATLRYRNGLTDYLPVLTQILTVQELDRSLIVQKENLLTNRVKLYRALGGTWPGDLLRRPPDTKL